MSGSDRPLLDIENLEVRFGGAAPAVGGLSLSVAAGEVVALVGESGCGKSTTALAVAGLLPRAARQSGAIRLDGERISGLSERRMTSVRGARIGMVFQEPMAALNPVISVGRQIVETLQAHLPLGRAAARARARELAVLVGLPDPDIRLGYFPHQLSGGQRQRVLIAMAIACNPRLLIADEPTTALDATIQMQIMALLDDLRRKRGLGMLLITHDMGLVSRWSHRVAVMHHGVLLDMFPTTELFAENRHPYTKGLVAASVSVADGLHYRSSRLTEVVVRKFDNDYRYELKRPSAPEHPPREAAPLLEVEDLRIRYATSKGAVTAVDGASLQLRQGESLGLVGESGSGKSSLARAIIRLAEPAGGRIRLQGRDITHLSQKQLRPLRSRIQMVFQDPYSSLNPRLTVSEALDEGLRVAGERDAGHRMERIRDTLDKVRLPISALHRYPHEFSGGQRQRIGIARALLLRPSLLICDECVSALDVSVQAQILNLLADLKAELGLSYLFISHDLGVVRFICDRVIVMRNARIVEEGGFDTLWSNPRTDYTRSLIAAAAG